jgi:ribosomal protein S18 acetylase RimI-like enzyme
VAKRQEGVQALTVQDGVQIVDVPRGEREALVQILEESFDGWYLRHSKGILRDVERVRAAAFQGAPVGLIMLKTLEAGVGYVYYVAVAKAHRRTGVAGLLLRDALRLFKDAGAVEVFASVEKENAPSERLFAAQGFARTSFAEVSRRHGPIRALNMYRMMVVVPGEILLHRLLA